MRKACYATEIASKRRNRPPSYSSEFPLRGSSGTWWIKGNGCDDPPARVTTFLVFLNEEHVGSWEAIVIIRVCLIGAEAKF